MWRFDDIQTRGVAHAPDHTLWIGGHELAVPVQDCSVRSDHHNGVVKRSASEFAFALVHAANDTNLMLRRFLTDRREVATAKIDRVRKQHGKDFGCQSSVIATAGP